MTIYKCSVCGCSVLIKDSLILRTCVHKEASVIAECSATVYGVSLVK